jgi:hypothetical protein
MQIRKVNFTGSANTSLRLGLKRHAPQTLKIHLLHFLSLTDV